MKKLTNVEVNVINLNANDVIATSGYMSTSLQNLYDSDDVTLVGARGYYDDEEEIW